jgi:hypothetical protein
MVGSSCYGRTEHGRSGRGGGIFKISQSEAVYRAPGVEKGQIE